MAFFQNGIDVSRYQGNINWGRVAAAGKQFAIVRIGSANSGGLYVDPYFLQNVNGAKAAGLRVGAYYYTYARTRAAAEVCGVGLAVVAAARAEAKAHAGNGNDGHAVGRLDRLSDDGVGIDHITDLIHRGVHEIVERGLLFDVFHEVHPFFLCGQFFTVFTVLRSALRWFFRGSVVFMRLFIA